KETEPEKARTIRMRCQPDWNRTGTLFRKVLSGSDAVSAIRYRGGFSVSLGGGLPRLETCWIRRNVSVYRRNRGRLRLRLEKGRPRVGEVEPQKGCFLKKPKTSSSIWFPYIHESGPL